MMFISSGAAKDNAADRQAAEAVFQKINFVLLNWSSDLTASQLLEFKSLIGRELVVNVVYPRMGKHGRVEFKKAVAHHLSRATVGRIVDEKIAQNRVLAARGIDSTQRSKAFNDFSEWVSMDYCPAEVDGTGKVTRVGLGEWRWDKNPPGSNSPAGYNIVRLSKVDGKWRLIYIQIPKMTYLLS
jgi:hypothetical protein